MSDMTIKAVRLTRLQVPWPQDPWLKGHPFGDTRNILVAEVETAGGIVGMGYLHVFRPITATIKACLEEVIVPRVIGKDATRGRGDLARPVDLYRHLRARRHCDHGAVAHRHRAVGRARQARRPAAAPLWGHVRSELPVYGSGCFRGSGGDGMIAKALHYKNQGFKAIKMQVAHTQDLKADLDNVRRMREAVGPDIEIMIDVNMGWTADVAIQMGRKFEDYDVYWLEEPVPPHDFDGYKRIARALDLRIVGGETHFTRFDLMPFFEDPVLPILQPDPMRGGFTDLRKTAALAEVKGIRIAPHLFPELNVQLVASLPNGSWIEDMRLSFDLWVEPVPVTNGTIVAPERPGHGLAFKPEILRDCAVR